jgi:hypothetical protein
MLPHFNESCANPGSEIEMIMRIMPSMATLDRLPQSSRVLNKLSEAMLEQKYGKLVEPRGRMRSVLDVDEEGGRSGWTSTSGKLPIRHAGSLADRTPHKIRYAALSFHPPRKNCKTENGFTVASTIIPLS